MRLSTRQALWVVGLGPMLALAACSATQQSGAQPSGFLRDYSQLKEGGEGEALLVYVNPKADFRKYTEITIDPVTIWADPGTKRIPRNEAQILADELDDSLCLALGEDYRLVDRAGPDTLRLRVAITEAEGSWHVEDLIGSKLDPELRAALPEEPSDETSGFVGKAGVEGELLDSATGERLLAAVDRRAGARRLKPEKRTWQDVYDAFDYWAERLRGRLADLRSKP